MKVPSPDMNTASSVIFETLDYSTVPNPLEIYPVPNNKKMIFLLPLLNTRPDLSDIFRVGEFTYYSDPEDPKLFFDKNFLYNFGYTKSYLKIGRYCSLAHGCQFIMPDANHAISGPSAYPFPGSWSDRIAVADVPLPRKGNTIVGHDVWIGHQATVMPGVRIGDGAIVGAMSVVTRDVPPYCVVAGNPARIIRERFTPEEVARLLSLAWWDWPPRLVLEAIPLLIKGNIDMLEAFMRSNSESNYNEQ